MSLLPLVPLWLFTVVKVFAYSDRQFPRYLYYLVYVLEHYEPLGQSPRRFDLAGEVNGLTYETAEHLFIHVGCGRVMFGARSSDDQRVSESLQGRKS